MSNWSLPQGARFETVGAGTGEGVTVTSSGTANTKGSYATIGTAGFNWSGFWLHLAWVSATRYRLDLTVNTGGSDQIIVADLFRDVGSNGNNIVDNVWVPIPVPSGATIKARMQTASGGLFARVLVTGYGADWPGIPRSRALVSLTAFTNTDPTGSVTQTNTSWTAWTEIVASTSNEVHGLYICAAYVGDSTRTTTRYLAEFGTGSAGSETARFIMPGQNAINQNAFWQPVWSRIPAGTRLAFRVQCNSGTAADTIGFGVSGLVP